MGFPNLDKLLVKLFLEKIRALRTDESYRLEELFGDFDAGEIQQVRQYLNAVTATDNIRDRGTGRFLYILPHYPLAELDYPQIGISVGTEDTAERFLGDETGDEPYPVKDGSGKVIAWDLRRGYWGSGQWNIEIAAGTKDEVIWLSRLCQLALVDNFTTLDAVGIKEVTLALADLRPDPNYYPQNIFLRGIKLVAGKVANTWAKREAASYYQTGVNLALEDL